MNEAPVERAILDTSVLIGPTTAPLPGIVAISAASLAELHFGVLVAKDVSTRAERLRRLSMIQWGLLRRVREEEFRPTTTWQHTHELLS